MFCINRGCPSQGNQYPGSPAAPLPLALPAPGKRRNRLPILILSLLAFVGLVIFLLLPSDSTQAAPAGGPVSIVQSGCFVLQDGILSFDESRYNGGPILIVPTSIDGQTVTAISAGCFEDVTGITTIELPGTIEAIYDRAFANCDDLRGLNIPNGCHTIGNAVFYGCSSLEALNVPASVTDIGSDAFGDCTRLLYIFYSGKYADWNSMYPDPITPFTWAICSDGEYRQGLN